MKNKKLRNPTRTIELLNELSHDPDPRYAELRDIVYDRKNEEMILKLPISQFFQVLHLATTPQKYGFMIQARVKKDLGYDKAKDGDSGDAYKDGINVEIKGSLITKTNHTINVRQTRQWQECEYNILGVDVRIITEPIIYFFKLTHLDMERELVLCKAGKSHARGEEKSITLKFDENDENFQRWCQNYRISSPWDKNEETLQFITTY